MKNFYFLLSSLLAYSSFAQDVITWTNGDTIQVKVKEVSDKSISYNRFNNLMGPLYTKDIQSVFQVKYENGDVEFFNKNTILPSVINDLSSSNPAALLAKGNNVFVEIPDEASRAGEKYFLEYLKDWGYWNLVSSKDEAHFVLEFNIDKKAMLDKSVWITFKTRQGTNFKESQHYRESTNAWNGYNAFKGAAKKIVEKYLRKEEFKK